MPDFFKEYRCKYCDKLFFKGNLMHCTIEIKCRKCKKFNFVKGLNCKFLLCSDQYASYTKSDGSLLSKEEVVSKALVQCPKCEIADHCGYYRIMNDDVGLFYERT